MSTTTATDTKSATHTTDAPIRAPSGVSVATAAVALGVSPSSIYRLVRDGALPHTRVRSGITIPAAALEAYRAAHTSTAWAPVGKLSRRGRRAGKGT